MLAATRRIDATTWIDRKTRATVANRSRQAADPSNAPDKVDRTPFIGCGSTKRPRGAHTNAAAARSRTSRSRPDPDPIHDACLGLAAGGSSQGTTRLVVVRLEWIEGKR
jgi:hypothetical protein